MNLTELVKSAGIVGAGGAGFPTHVKIDARAEYFIVNAAECEPLIETDKYICRQFADKLISAILAVSAHLHAAHTIIAIKTKYHTEIATLKEAIAKRNADIEFFLMDSYYPAGDEQVIVQQITGRSVPERGIPLYVGVVVSNVGTLLNISLAMEGKTLTHKFLSVVGEVNKTIILEVPLGTAILDCIAQAMPKIEDYGVILGGPMMGTYITDSAQIRNEVVKKTLGNIIVLPKNHYLFTRNSLSLSTIKHQALSSCIQCRMCTDLCPRYQIGHTIRPHLVMRNIFREHTIHDDYEFQQAFGDAINCCECGICEMFACPMGLSPRKVNVHIKQILRQKHIESIKNQDSTAPIAKDSVNNTKIPTDRLIARLGLFDYYSKHVEEVLTLRPKHVRLALSQHIGKPSIPIVSKGERVKLGQLIATIPDNSLGAHLHASIEGIVSDITETHITLNGEV